MTIKDLQPKIVWDNFYGITRQPRPSKHEEKIRAWLLDWAKQRNIEAFADETGNVIMRKPATPGMENLKGVIMQGHMDMVPQKNADVLKEPHWVPITVWVLLWLFQFWNRTISSTARWNCWLPMMRRQV